MNLKKITALFLSLAFVLVLPLSTSANGKWDYVGQRTLTKKTTDGNYTNSNNVVHSTGGNFKFCNPANSKSVYFVVYEKDEAGNPDEWITSRTVPKGQCTSFSVKKFVDGSNKKAEIYVKASSKVTLKFWD